MGNKILTYLKANATGHVLGIVVAVAIVLGFRSYMAEHDARVAADAQVKAVQTRIDSLQAQKKEVTKTAAAAVRKLQDSASEIKTPKQAGAAIPEVSDAPLDVQFLPDAPEKVSVNAVPLYQELNVCKQDAVNLGACSANLKLQEEIDKGKDEQITALKKKPGFWHRVGTAAKWGAILGGGGYVLGRIQR